MTRTRIYRIDADEIKYQYIKIKKDIFLCFFPYFYLLIFYLLWFLSAWYCLPDSHPLLGFNPETSSRVTLGSLGIAFQANLIREIRLIRGRMKSSEVMCVFFEHGFIGLTRMIL